ncbi:MAG: hypothetical protein JW839_19665 [Candidatus Lokiarchaeota archaeon]|nr:hypothetical protein [Candidatus Lokiarchaeota archaeon]
MDTVADLRTPKRDMLWLQRTFETHLPVAVAAAIVIPTIMFGMFTMGLNPEDSALRTAYYLVITAVMPVSVLAGYVLALIPARKLLLVILDAAAGVAAVLSYLWFQARISVVPADYPSSFPGWQWQSHYQQDLLAVLVVILSVRCGMSFPRRGATPSAEGDTSVVSAASLSLLLVASSYLVSWLLGTWWLLHLYAACFAFAGCGVHLLLPNRPPSTNKRRAGVELKNRAWTSLLFGFGIPFLMLAQGFAVGLSFVANSWSSGWLGHIGVILLMASLVPIGILVVEKRYKKETSIAWPLLAAAGLLLCSIVSLACRAFLPAEIGWAMTGGSAAGMIATALAKLATNNRRPFRATVQLLLAMFCVLLGIGGGIAYYLYAGQSFSFLPGSSDVLSEDLVMWIVIGSAIFAAVVIGHVPAISTILRSLYHEVHGAK